MNSWSKEVFAKNLQYYLNISGKTQKEVAQEVGVSAPTMSDWVSGKKYPRIDKIELLAKQFGILKSDLIENKSEAHKEMQKNNDTLAGIIIRMRTDSDFFSLVEKLNNLDKQKLEGVNHMINAFIN